MRVYDFGGVHKVDNITDLDQLLRTRFGNGENEFLLSHDFNDFPALSILVKGDLAAAYYFPRAGHAGFASVGEGTAFGRDGMTSFSTGSLGQAIEISNRAIIPISTALAVAREFFRCAELPRSIEWLEL